MLQNIAKLVYLEHVMLSVRHKRTIVLTNHRYPILD